MRPRHQMKTVNLHNEPNRRFESFERSPLGDHSLTSRKIYTCSNIKAGPAAKNGSIRTLKRLTARSKSERSRREVQKFTANPEIYRHRYFLTPSSRCASRSKLVSETSFRETWRVIFMDFLKFSITIRSPSSGMVPSELNTPTEES